MRHGRIDLFNKSDSAVQQKFLTCEGTQEVFNCDVPPHLFTSTTSQEGPMRTVTLLALALLAVLFAPPGNAQDLSAGLVAYYPFNVVDPISDVTIDESGNGQACRQLRKDLWLLPNLPVEGFCLPEWVNSCLG